MKILNLSTNISKCKDCPNAIMKLNPPICADTGHSLSNINIIPSWCTLLDCTCTDGKCSGCTEFVDKERLECV